MTSNPLWGPLWSKLLLAECSETTELTVARLWLGEGQAVGARGALWSTPRGRAVVSGHRDRILGPEDPGIGLAKGDGVGIWWAWFRALVAFASSDSGELTWPLSVSASSPVQ